MRHSAQCPSGFSLAKKSHWLLYRASSQVHFFQQSEVVVWFFPFTLFLKAASKIFFTNFVRVQTKGKGRMAALFWSRCQNVQRLISPRSKKLVDSSCFMVCIILLFYPCPFLIFIQQHIHCYSMSSLWSSTVSDSFFIFSCLLQNKQKPFVFFYYLSVSKVFCTSAFCGETDFFLLALCDHTFNLVPHEVFYCSICLVASKYSMSFHASSYFYFF